MSANPTTYQYEPLRVPKNWGAEEKKLILQLTDIFDDVYRRYGRLRFEDMGNVFRNRIISDEGNISEIEQTAENILLEVGTDKVYRALSEAVLIAELGARVPAVEVAVNLVWYDTTNKLMKRCTAVGPPIAWEVLQTNEVHTSSIDIAQDSIDIASTGSINLSAASQITIGTKPMEVGGTNLIPGTSNEYADVVFTADEWRYCTEECDAADIGLIPGELATVSAYIKCPAGVPSNGIEIGWAAFDSGDDWIVNVEGNGILSSSEGISKATFTVPAGTEYIKFYLNTNPFKNYTGTIKYKRLKLERGNVATAWCESEGELHNSSITIDNDGIAIATGGTFSVESGNFDIDTDGTVYIGSHIRINPDSSMVVSAIGGTYNYIQLSGTGPIEMFDNVDIVGDLVVQGNLDAGTYTDFTPAFTGDALTALSTVKHDGTGEIDHATLPLAAQKKISVTQRDERGKVVLDKKGKPIVEEKPGRDISMMISILTKAVQQLTDRIEKLEAKK